MRLQCFQHDPLEGLGSIEEWAVQHGFEIEVTRFYRGDPLPDPDGFDWLAVMGGPMSVYEEEYYPWLAREKQFIASAIAGKKKVLGICLGAQLIASALGAKVYPNAHKEFGWYPVQLTPEAHASRLFSTWPETLNVLHWHGDTFDVPAGAMRIGQSEACQNQGFLYGSDVLALQFHIEITEEGLKAALAVLPAEDICSPGKYIQPQEQVLAPSEFFTDAANRLREMLDVFGEWTGRQLSSDPGGKCLSA